MISYLHTGKRTLPLIMIILIWTGWGQCPAQNVWTGGKPGQESSWNCAGNWSQKSVPDNDDLVIIPCLLTRGEFYPIIKTTVSTIAGLEVHSGASLTCTAEGVLTIDGSQTFDHGLINLGTLIISGSFTVSGTGLQDIINEGIIIDNTQTPHLAADKQLVTEGHYP